MAGAVLTQLLPHLIPHVLNYFMKDNETWNGKNPKQNGNIQGYDYNQDPQVQNAMKLWGQSPYNQQFNPQQANQQFEEQIANPSTKYYQERIQPNTRNQFFDPSGVHGSAMQKALNQGAEDLGGSLASLRSNYLQNAQGNHAKGQYDLIAQQLGLANNRAAQNQPIIEGETQGIGGGIQELLSKLLGSDQFQGLFKNTPSLKGSTMPWDVPGQISSQPQQSGSDFYNNLVKSWEH